MGVGENIARRREAIGMTQEELAEAVGYKHKSSINKIEKGINTISDVKLVQIADALGCTTEYIVHGEQKEVYYPNITEKNIDNVILDLVSQLDRAHLLQLSVKIIELANNK